MCQTVMIVYRLVEACACKEIVAMVLQVVIYTTLLSLSPTASISIICSKGWRWDFDHLSMDRKRKDKKKLFSIFRLSYMYINVTNINTFFFIFFGP